MSPKLKVLTNTLPRIIYSNQEPTLPLHLQAVWQLDSTKVGLVFLAGIIPSVIGVPRPIPSIHTRSRQSISDSVAALGLVYGSLDATMCDSWSADLRAPVSLAAYHGKVPGILHCDVLPSQYVFCALRLRRH